MKYPKQEEKLYAPSAKQKAANGTHSPPPNYRSAKSGCDPELAEALIALVVAFGNQANVNEPKLKMPQFQKSPLHKGKQLDLKF
jgi:hypothetical protein